MNIQIKVNENYEVRTEEYNGKQMLVIPVVMMVEGVHSGSKGAVLNLASEFGKIPASWNGIPVMENHPVKDGNYVSANSPDILEEAIGQIFNTKIEGDKLSAEAWIDKSKLMNHKELSELISKNMPIEVSIGSFSDDEEKEGVYKGSEYVAVAYNYRPDHLALLPGATGACSIKDGCGIRNNQASLSVNALSFVGTETTTWKKPTMEDFGIKGKWSAISRQRRNNIAEHFLIGTGVVPAFGMLHFPVVNPKTGKLNENALRAVISGRGAQLKGDSNLTKAAQKRAYVLLNKEFKAKLEIPTTLEGQISLINKMGDLFSEMGNYNLEELYSDFVIFAKWNTENNNSVKKLFSQKFELDKNGIPALVGEPVEVVKKVNYLKVNIMEEKKKIEEKPVVDVVKQEKPKTVSDYLKDAPAEIKEQVQEGLRVFRAEKTNMIDTIITNSENGLWDEKELSTMKHDTLRKLFITVNEKKDYSILGANTTTSTAEAPLGFPGIKMEVKK